ncbi:uncharacterized protein LOC106171094 [Lingula anatina]|uniref:Uncharacterized protein LOC106171094 n=1 Tax=Lingula anatina TaxID=7574 RepID=A0A1S3J8F8_LINAN|nr:uncharacterized protein LOC106171094 [Lingula anatina]XP_013406686.1 uncharacterized protein LOC106171094 [Lingula anatina]XP_013406687.1 uncharacterized protein LOC106171094 [Lingula anatina]|eukprot:XP_013406685.1 uncharacterized protein LOC106171094 [Lingula anatina]
MLQQRRVGVLPKIAICSLITGLMFVGMIGINNFISSPATKDLIKRKNFTLITGANTGYFKRGLRNFIGSIHFWEPYRKIVVYDLGLTPDEVTEVKTWCRVTYERFDFSEYPKHVSDLHQFAWKPLVVQKALEKFGKILWIDAGTEFRGPLNEIEKLLEQDGHFFVQRQDFDMTRLIADGMYKALHVKKEAFWGNPSYAGGLTGWTKDGLAHRHILTLWVKCALNKDCNSPRGASKNNHRFDQAALSVLIHSAKGVCVRAHSEFVTHIRSEVPANENQPTTRVLFTARQRSVTYVKRIKKCGGAIDNH